MKSNLIGTGHQQGINISASKRGDSFSLAGFRSSILSMVFILKKGLLQLQSAHFVSNRILTIFVPINLELIGLSLGTKFGTGT
jgi:hypothetical protein